MSEDCVFCRIVAGELPTREAYSSPSVYAFHDQQPVAPVHVLVVPRQHVADAAALGPEHGEVLAEMAVAAQAVAAQEGIAKGGYRLVFNVGRDSGAQVPHLHLHVIGGRKMAWPPG
jgi:histidine triad (HIT) family protein